VAEELLKIEGFNDVQYVEVPLDAIHRSVGTDKIDMSMGFIANYIIEVDSDTPIKLLAGVHAGCFELFGTKRVNAIRDLKGKTVAVPALGSAHHNFVASMAAHVGLDAKREINFVTHPVGESGRLLAEEKATRCKQ
jgi:NitT/TauT family transport system substrate-binding protein